MTSEKVPRHLIRKAEDTVSPLRVLEGVGELRKYLDELEKQALLDARAQGVSPTDMAVALGITRQGVHHKLRQLDRRSASLRSMELLAIPEIEPEPH